MIQVKTLEQTPIADIASAFNSAFADYFVKLHITEEQLGQRFIAEGVDLTTSLGAFDDEVLVGFVLNGFDNINDITLSYNAGTGVVPSYRGKGLTKALYNEMLPILKERGAQECLLEVITDNKPAISIYKNVGYSISRELRCYKSNGRLTVPRPDTKFRLLNVTDTSWFAEHTDVQPSWQYTPNAIMRSVTPKRYVEIYDGDNIIGKGIFNPQSGRVLYFWVNGEHRRKSIGSELFRVMDANSELPLTVINVGSENEGIDKFLKQLGFEHFITQYEMAMSL